MLRFTADPPNLMYPDYSKMNKYPIEQDFWTIRSKTWGITETYLQLPSRLLKLISGKNSVPLAPLKNLLLMNRYCFLL